MKGLAGLMVWWELQVYEMGYNPHRQLIFLESPRLYLIKIFLIITVKNRKSLIENAKDKIQATGLAYWRQLCRDTVRRNLSENWMQFLLQVFIIFWGHNVWKRIHHEGCE